MLKDIKTTALMVAVTLTFVRLHWIVGQIQLVAAVHHSQWIAVAQLAGNSLFLIPLPALLWILYTTNTTPLISGGLRPLVLITALVEGLLLAVPQVYGLVRGVQRLPGLRGFRGETLAGQLWGWVQNPWVGTLLWEGLVLMSQVALILFLVALYLRGQLSEITYGPSRQLAKRIAAVAVFVGAIAVVLSVSQLGYSTIMVDERADQLRWIGTEVRNQFILRNSFSQLPILCWAAVAWIVYRGLVQTTVEEPKTLS